jgi:phosphatidyl-myo-inositol dimannoside synthase
MVLGLFGSLSEHGGMERANRLAASVLAEMAHEEGQACELLSLNDGPGRLCFAVGGRQYSSLGFGRSKVRLLSHALGLAPHVHVAYLGTSNFGPVGLLLRAINPRAQYWVATHGFEVWHPLRSLGRFALRQAQGVTAPSRFTLHHLLETQGLNPGKVALLPHGLEPGFADPDSNQDLPPATEPGLILTVARLKRIEPGKGVDTVIRALPRLIQAVPHASYVIVGDGDLRPSLRRLAEEAGVPDRVRFVGHLDEREMREYYRKAEVFVMPSRQEGFGIVFLEAMAFGKPVIGGAYGGTRDIIIEGETGFLVEYGDIEAITDRLIRLLRDPDLRKRMGIAGRQRVTENYSFDRFRTRLRGLLNGTQPASPPPGKGA